MGSELFLSFGSILLVRYVRLVRLVLQFLVPRSVIYIVNIMLIKQESIWSLGLQNREHTHRIIVFVLD